MPLNETLIIYTRSTFVCSLRSLTITTMGIIGVKKQVDEAATSSDMSHAVLTGHMVCVSTCAQVQ